MLTVGSVSVPAPMKDTGQNHHRTKPYLFTVIKQGRGQDFAHRSGASTLEPVELEKSYTPPSHLPQTSQPTFTCAELTPLTWAPGPHPMQRSNSVSMYLSGTKGHLFQQQAKFFHGNIALNFKNQSQ